MTYFSGHVHLKGLYTSKELYVNGNSLVIYAGLGVSQKAQNRSDFKIFVDVVVFLFLLIKYFHNY